MDYRHAFAIVSDDHHFPGLEATLGSLYAYYGQEIRVFVISHRLREDYRQRLDRHPLGPAMTRLDTSQFSRKPTSDQAARQQVLSELVEYVHTLCLIAPGVLLLSRLDDLFEWAQNGRIVTTSYLRGRDALRECPMPDGAVGPSRSCCDNGLLVLNLRTHWDLVGLLDFASVAGRDSITSKASHDIPEGTFQSILSTILERLKKLEVVQTLQGAAWESFPSEQAVPRVRIADREGSRLVVLNEPGGERRRILCFEEPALREGEELQAFARGGDRLACFEIMRSLSNPMTEVGFSNATPPNPAALLTIAEPELSICVTIKNRSRVQVEGEIRELFPNCVRSILKAAAGLAIEIVVVDFCSDDWPLQEWFPSLMGSTPHQLLTLNESFSRGRGLNMAASAARSERLLFVDADMLLDRDVLTRAIEVINSGGVWLPVCVCLNPDHSFESWGYLGNVASSKAAWAAAGKIPEFHSWGGEDNQFMDRLQARFRGVRENCAGFRHQWHPDKLRHLHYRNPCYSDYQNREDKVSGDQEFLLRLTGDHPDWTGDLLVFKTGRMGRSCRGFGTFEITQGTLTLRWDAGYVDQFDWEPTHQTYRHTSQQFALGSTDIPSCVGAVVFARMR